MKIKRINRENDTFETLKHIDLELLAISSICCQNIEDSTALNAGAT
jgi:hypothetical protein